MFEEIAREIHLAATDGHKTAMLHFLVLKHAHHLANVDATEFCRLVGIQESYATEFRKMLSLARLLERQGASIVWGR